MTAPVALHQSGIIVSAGIFPEKRIYERITEMEDFISAWTREIKNDGDEFKPIRPGTYPAVISRLEQGEHPGSAKIPKCEKAILTLKVDTGSGTRDVKATLYLHEHMDWKLSEFFRSVGRKKRGEAFRMDWSNLIGQRLLVRIGTRSYTGRDGEEHVANNVDKFLDYDPDAFPTDPDWMKDALAANVQDDELDEVF